jgi:hypothetical protein
MFATIVRAQGPETKYGQQPMSWNYRPFQSTDYQSERRWAKDIRVCLSNEVNLEAIAEKLPKD